MSKLLYLLFFFGFVSNLAAQSPEQIPYQAIIRDNAGELLTDQAVSIQFSLRQGSLNGQIVFQEIVNTTSSNIGVVKTEIGSGMATQGKLAEIDWSVGPYFLEIGYDLSGGSDFTLMGTTPLLSVPYSLHAKTAAQALSKTKDERESMTAIPQGQLLFCNNCGNNGELQIYNGTKWTNMLGEDVVE